MSTNALLAQYLSIESQISACELQKTRWSNLQEAMSKKLSEQETAEEKWGSASDKVEEVWGDNSASLIYKNTTYWNKGAHPSFAVKQSAATAYANAKVPKFDKEKLEEYSDLDMEYSTMVNMYETLLTELDAQKEGTKTRLESDAGDNHIIGGS